MQIGRYELLTDVPEITYENIIPILQELLPIHQRNADRIKFLDEYEKGNQPIQRKNPKKYRPDIDCQCVDNVANEVTDFKTAFHWGNPITLVQRGEDKKNNSAITEGISILNQCYEAEENRKKTQHLARNVEVGCLGYTYIDLNMDEQDIKLGGSYFKVESLEPTNTFVIRSSYYFDKRVMIAGTYREIDGVKRITAFTDEFRFELKGFEHTERSGEANPLGIIPIIEWFRSYDRMGCFERQISEMDNLNLLVSDFTNDIEQSTQVVWHTVDVEFPTVITKNEDGTETEEVRKPKSNEWLQTYSTADGKTPKIAPLVVDYDYDGMLKNIVSRRALILQKCNVPSRNDNSGGSTGIAMDSATGWSAAEAEAQKQQNIMEACKMEEVKVVLRAIQVSPHVPSDSPLLKLKHTDIQPNIKRSKTYELVTKCNSLTTLLSHGFDLKDAVQAIPLFEDNTQVIERSGEGVKKYQEAHAFGDTKEEIKDKVASDNSDQITNSPFIDK